jgi:hypothetical protein
VPPASAAGLLELRRARAAPGGGQGDDACGQNTEGEPGHLAERAASDAADDPDAP